MLKKTTPSSFTSTCERGAQHPPAGERGCPLGWRFCRTGCWAPGRDPQTPPDAPRPCRRRHKRRRARAHTQVKHFYKEGSLQFLHAKKKKKTRERDARALRAALTGPADGTDRGDVSRALGTSEAPPSPVVSAPDDHEVSVAVQHLPAGVVMVLLHTKAAGGSGAKH